MWMANKMTFEHILLSAFVAIGWKYIIWYIISLIDYRALNDFDTNCEPVIGKVVYKMISGKYVKIINQ